MRPSGELNHRLTYRLNCLVQSVKDSVEDGHDVAGGACSCSYVMQVLLEANTR